MNSHRQQDDVSGKMDRMYGVQRHFYDLTRKYYLLGRDRLLRTMPVEKGDKILEVGCGTGRNLSILAKLYPDAQLFGIDASRAMLTTAAEKNRKNANLEQALAGEFNYAQTFGLTSPFDTIFFSYSISMMPEWREAIENALANVKHGGDLFIVDFYDQRGLPSWFGAMLRAWLRKFHVRFWEDLIPFMKEMEDAGKGRLTVVPLFRGYSFMARFEKA